MIELRKSVESEINTIMEFENSADVSEFIVPTTLEKHRTDMLKPEITYLSIVDEDSLLGYIILAIEDDLTSIEFRRIVIDSKGQGVGQVAIREMEHYCKNNLKAKRIWLDVFDANKRGKHIYNKLGYRQFKVGELNGQSLLYMDKIISRCRFPKLSHSVLLDNQSGLI
jgi:RimJ/RimL family protein N-acetyltransferase